MEKAKILEAIQALKEKLYIIRDGIDEVAVDLLILHISISAVIEDNKPH